MQYGFNFMTYNKTDSRGKININKEILMLVFMFIGGILISRVTVFFNMEGAEAMAPFGVAYFISVILMKDHKKTIVSFIGIISGYLTSANLVSNQYINIVIVAVLLVYGLAMFLIGRKIHELEIMALLFLSYIGSTALVYSYPLKINLIIAIMNTIIIVPVYYIIKSGMECIYELDSNYLFSTEEIISIGIILCLMICGIGDITIGGLSIRTIFAYSAILIFTYAGGGTYGASFGVAMGLIIGISSGNVMESICYFSILGLVSGIFKDTGKLFTSLTYLLTFACLAMYFKNINILYSLEVILGSALFLLVPKSLLKFITIEVNIDKKREQINQIELNELKKEFNDKVNGLGRVLNSVGNTLYDLNTNNMLKNKDKSTRLIGNLADIVCSNCARCKQCWSRDFNTTYGAFSVLLRSCEEKYIHFPNELEKICLEKEELINSAENLVLNLKNNELKKERLEEGRKMVAKHIKNIAESIDHVLNDFKRDVVVCTDVDKLLRKALSKKFIQYKNIFAYRDIKGRIKIKITFVGSLLDSGVEKEVMNIVNEVVNNPMIICEGESKSYLDVNEYTMVLEEVPKYQVISYGAISSKEGEEYIGDTYSFGKTNVGEYMTIISDGMGSGPEAGRESTATVEIIEKFLQAGFDDSVAINMVNTIMAMKFDEDEKYSTLDLNIIDLYTGEIVFKKLGAVSSFIKRGKNIKKITSNMPPFGIVDELEVDGVKEKLKSGDLVITISDGILEADSELICNEGWIEKYLTKCSKEPKKLAQDIVEKAKDFNDGIAKDDMTVVVSKIYAIY
ncbi:MAG: stage II sporulation protein E [Clostridiales bacterium]|nr:stage II sporulation protein E [Clostridiales bacterium]